MNATDVVQYIELTDSLLKDKDVVIHNLLDKQASIEVVKDVQEQFIANLVDKFKDLKVIDKEASVSDYERNPDKLLQLLDKVASIKETQPKRKSLGTVVNSHTGVSLGQSKANDLFDRAFS